MHTTRMRGICLPRNEPRISDAILRYRASIYQLMSRQIRARCRFAATAAIATESFSFTASLTIYIIQDMRAGLAA